MVIEFYYHNGSLPSLATWMVLENLDIEYRPIVVDLFTGEQTKAKFAAINPNKQVPAIIDGDIKLAESRAIAIYLCNKYEPKDKKEKLCPTGDIDEMARFNSILLRDIDNYNFMMTRFLNSGKVYSGKGTGPIPGLFPKALAILQEMDFMVADTKYVFGDHVTILDLFILQTLLAAEMGGIEVCRNYLNLARWTTDLKKLPGYEKSYGKHAKYNMDLYSMLNEAAKKKGL